MTVRHDQDLLSKIQSSYLWSIDEEQPNNVIKNKPTEDLNINSGLLQATSPRFTALLERSQTISSKPIPSQQVRATSISEMQLISKETVKPNTPPTLRTSEQANSEASLINNESSSKFARFAFLAKSGNAICQARLSTVALVGFTLALCVIVTGILLGINLKSPGTTTTATTTVPTTVITTSTSSTTSTTSTTTTPPATAWIPINYNTSCSSTCTNVSTVTASTLLASWTFENNANDVSGNGNNGEITNGAAFTTGYVGQGIIFRIANLQYVNASYINLVNQGFTVEAWVYPYTLSLINDISIMGECESNTIDRCLHYILRQNKPYMGFFGDDLAGTTPLTTNTWYHLAYVYDYSLNVKYIYLNGIIDATSGASGAPASTSSYLGASGNVLLGTSSNAASSFLDGVLDQVTITNRAKTPCEILNDASLVAHFPLDGNSNDIGPNSITATYTLQGNNGLRWVSGQVNQALNFNASNSYFESCGYYALGRNQPYSIAMWINPSFQRGTLFHLSSAATGSGAWCLPMIGFSSNGSIVVQTWIGTVAVSVMGPILPINSWTHIVQTYSSTNGLRLYLNGGLYNSAIASTFGASSVTMCILLGSSGLGTNCQTGSISMAPYSGSIDELYIYNRELNSAEVCPLAHP